MNWYVHGRTSKQVGFLQEGSVCEGGNCEHLAEGDQAFGFSGEADEFGEERYLMCKECYEAFLAQRKTEPLECSDCGNEFPRNTLTRYIPYVLDGSPSENEDSKRWVCKTCVELPRHQQRLENDEFLREEDDRRADDLDDRLGFDEPDDDDDDDTDYSEQIYYWARDTHKPKRYSKCIQDIVVDNKNFYRPSL